MTKVLNSQCPYNIITDDNTFSYVFITKNNIEYRVAFVDAINIFESTIGGDEIKNVYTLIIEKINNCVEPLDFRVQQTVKKIVKDFFNDKTNSILYICEELDSKGLKRHSAFNRWYNSSEESAYLKKIDGSVFSVDYDSTVYTSIIYHCQHPQGDLLEESYLEIISGLNNK